MPKSLFFNLPAYGHINPSLPLVTELTQRGHEISYFATEPFRAPIEATGARFHPYPLSDTEFFNGSGFSGKYPMLVVYELMTAAQRLLPTLLDFAHAERPDYILHDGGCPWGLMIAQILKLPAVTSVALMPSTPPTPYMLRDGDFVRFLASIFLHDFDKGRAAGKIAQALAKQYGIPPLGLANMLNAYGDLCISYSSDTFVPNATKTKANFRYVGWTPTTAVNSGTVDFDAVQGRPLIYVSLGTIDSDAAWFFRACIEAFRDCEYSVIMSTGSRVTPESFGVLPSNIAIYNWVPQRDVLERADLFVTHGGMNSVHDGLYFGRPLLVVPQQGEQAIIARRVQELGAGIKLSKSQVTAEQLRTSAERLLHEENFKAAAHRIGASLRSAGGVGKAADEIESFLKARR